jgi:TolB-like protein/Flp pilus assembly protein TadD
LAACRLTLFGGFTLATDDGRQLSLPTRKDRLLLGYLALSPGRVMARERLAGLLWSDRAEAQARDSLKQSLAGMRQVFRQAGLDPLRTDRDSVALEPDRIETDVLEFATLATASTSLDRAAALYRGELLEGIDGTSPEFEAWLHTERERLNDLAIHVLEQRALCAAPNGVTDDAIRLGRYLLTRDQLREPVYRALMRLFALKGDRAEALKLYAALREALKQDLQVEPDAKTEDLYRDILTDRLALPSTVAAAERTRERPSIAVLPFSNLSGDPDLAHLCDGITEDTITGLGRFHLLFVIDRHSSSAVSEQISDVAEIGRRLGVCYLVQGSLQRLGDGVRITVRLIDAGSRAQLWGEAYGCALSEILAVPDKVTGAIVSTLHNRVESSLLEQARRKPTLAAYECVLRGIKHLRGYGPDDNRCAVELFQQAMDLDPDYALARAYRAFADVVLHGYGDAPDAVLAQALSLAQTAIDLDAGDGRCHWILGAIQIYRGDWRNAEQHYQRAVALNPNDANAICSSGRMLARRGQVQKGIDRIREAMRLNPYHPEHYWQNLGSVLHMARKYADSAEAYGRMTRPGYWVLCRLAGCYAQLGRMNEATDAAADALRLRPDFSLAKVRLREVDTAEAEHIKDGMRRAGLPE